jgi:FMN phosphatase YigB (HAD superfamily)
MKESWVIFDLDGTLADVTHRLHHIKKEKPDWDSFNKDCVGDSVKPSIAYLLKVMKFVGHKIAIFSGRMATVELETKSWLALNGIEYDILAMRAEENYESDVTLKKGMYEKYLSDKEVVFCVDDRDKVVALWRSLGLTCLQCQKGDY